MHVITKACRKQKNIKFTLQRLQKKTKEVGEQKKIRQSPAKGEPCEKNKNTIV